MIHRCVDTQTHFKLESVHIDTEGKVLTQLQFSGINTWSKTKGAQVVNLSLTR